MIYKKWKLFLSCHLINKGKHTPPPYKPKSESSGLSICCKMHAFNDTGCSFEKNGTCKKLHACASCEEKGFYDKHHAIDCKK